MSEYYSYKPGQGRWWHKTPPYLDPHYQAELTRCFGRNHFGSPHLRIVWAGTLMSDTSSVPTLKYKATWRGMVGFNYTDEAGVVHRVKSVAEVPEGKMAIAVYDTIELGRLRWLIEVWMSTADAIKAGRFDSEILGLDGKPLYRPAPPEGIYNAYFWIQTLDGGFRTMDDGVLEVVKEMYQYSRSTPVAKQYADIIEDDIREEKENKEQTQAVWGG